jgi:hypothetical protein
MKRWIVFILLIAAGLMAGPVSAQSKDVAGSWTLDAAKTGSKEGPPMVVITLAEKEFTARLGSATARLMTFRTDGTETDVSQGVRGKALWKGSRLEATLITPRGPETVTFWREGEWLAVEASTEKGPMKFFFGRTPSGK